MRVRDQSRRSAARIRHCSSLLILGRLRHANQRPVVKVVRPQQIALHAAINIEKRFLRRPILRRPLRRAEGGHHAAPKRRRWGGGPLRHVVPIGSQQTHEAQRGTRVGCPPQERRAAVLSSVSCQDKCRVRLNLAWTPGPARPREAANQRCGCPDDTVAWGTWRGRRDAAQSQSWARTVDRGSRPTHAPHARCSPRHDHAICGTPPNRHPTVSQAHLPHVTPCARRARSTRARPWGRTCRAGGPTHP